MTEYNIALVGFGGVNRALAQLIAERNQARENKDYARADELRDRLMASGIELSDSSDNTHWKVN